MVYRLDAMEAYNKKLVKKIAVKGITESGSTATESYVYLQGINLSKDAPTATLQFDCKTKSGMIKTVTRVVRERYNLYDHSGELEEYRNGFVVKRIDGRDDSVEFLNGIKIYAGDVTGRVSEEQIRKLQIRETILSHLERDSYFIGESKYCPCFLLMMWIIIKDMMQPGRRRMVFLQICSKRNTERSSGICSLPWGRTHTWTIWA